MQVKIFSRSVLGGREGLAARAQDVLRQNDMGGWTRAASDLYPHQWSWDTGFIAIGLAHLDTRRAAQELLTLFQHQWKTGKVPHIVFNPEARELLPRPRSLGLRRGLCRRSARAALHQLPVPAANPRHSRSEDLGSRQQREGARRGYCLPA